ncbi:hypothetical protein AB1L30_13200 [Bremerella sp. JC817]|uniref:hypothetical protein n=1 Tax=Bremerella sp. JC817 TaxID=3231756 RepID=UPI0034586E87
MKIRSFKHSGPLTRIERICLASFAAHHDDVELLSYTPIENLPEGVIAVDANEILPESSSLFRKNSRKGIEAIVRWRTLLERGDCYVSTDMLCIRPFDFDEPIVFGRKSDVDSYRWGHQALIFPAHHPACQFMLNRCLNPHFPVPGEKLRHRIKKAIRRRITGDLRPIRSWIVGDEGGFQVAVDQMQLDHLAQPIPVFFPIHEARWRSPYDDTFRNDWGMLPSTRAVYLNSFEVQRNKFDLEAPFEPGSLMDYYEQKYLGEPLLIAA